MQTDGAHGTMIAGTIGGILGALVGFLMFPPVSRAIRSAAAKKSRRLGVPPAVLPDGTKTVRWPPGLLGTAACFSVWIWALLTFLCGVFGAWIGASLA